jgi:hypothetical protein
MPNGGSDNCGTCWFNRRNNGRYAQVVDRSAEGQPPDECMLRVQPITTPPFYTYCANHPQHNSEDGQVLRSQTSEGSIYYDFGPTVPIGPILTMKSHAEGRVLSADSPDSAYVREYLLAIAKDMHRGNWPLNTVERIPQRWHAVLWQLGEFREQRAVPALQALLAVQLPSRDEQLKNPLAHLWARRWEDLQESARKALAKIAGQPATP